MIKARKAATAFAIVLLCAPAVSIAQQASKHSQQQPESGQHKALLWTDPADIGSRNLFYGEGGKEDVPPTNFTFLKEDLKGTNPKFDVRDENGVKWRIKLGEEARPETVATRLLWAVGYFANETYFLPTVHVDQMQPVSKKRRKRVRGLLDPDGTMHDVELRRFHEGKKKIGTWTWRHNPFVGTRELNGLRVMMAVLNNWDLKDENNAIYLEKKLAGDEKNQGTPDDPEEFYLVSDVGASFGTTGRVRDRARAKGNLESYRRSKFIRRITPDYVDFYVPARESFSLAVNPKEFVGRLELRWIGQRIPRADAKWTGQLLAQLSPDQIRDAFRAAGYSPQEVEAFSSVVVDRIAQLNDL